MIIKLGNLYQTKVTTRIDDIVNDQVRDLPPDTVACALPKPHGGDERLYHLTFTWVVVAETGFHGYVWTESLEQVGCGENR